MNTKKIAIAIDGPAGAGKSSISKVVANELGYLYIDTGAMYRGVTWAVLDSHVDVKNQKDVESLLPSLDLTLEPTANACKVFVKGQDVTDLIRQQQINENVSTIASYKGVREYLVERQQAMAAVGG
ncbi:MAG: (d)CMP kinase, partial [Veillonella sp.]